MASDNRITIIGNNEHMPLWYTLACTNEYSGNTLEMANRFYESGKFAAAEPNFLIENMIDCVNDTYFSQ